MLAATATQLKCVPLRRNLPSDPHITFTLAFRPGQRLFHRFALIVSQAHLRMDGLRIDLLGDLRWRRRRGDRQDLMLVRIWIMVECPLRRAFLGPRLQGRQFFERRQIVAAAGRYKLLDRSRLRQMYEQALRGCLVLGEVPCGPEEGGERRKPAFRSRREAMRPALLGHLRRITLGDCHALGGFMINALSPEISALLLVESSQAATPVGSRGMNFL